MVILTTSVLPPLSLLSPSLSLSLSFPCQLYSPYISNFDKALKTLEEHSKRNPLFAQVVKEFEIEPKCNNLTVAAYLLETVQRIPRYKLLLSGMTSTGQYSIVVILLSLPPLPPSFPLSLPSLPSIHPSIIDYIKHLPQDSDDREDSESKLWVAQ